MPIKKTSSSDEIVIKAIGQSKVRLRIIGTTPMFQNRMSAKAKNTLLVGGGKKTKAERAGIKHQPYDEYRDSAEIIKNGPTALGLRVVAVKAAMCTAALETEGITKASAQKLLFMPGEHAPLYGTPQLRMDVVRSADINRTPDIRSRCFLPRWGAEIDVNFVVPQLSHVGVVTLLANAGFLIGVGDFRQEKGKGNFGLFRVLGEGEQDDEWDDLVENHGRASQLHAIEHPELANEETEELVAHFQETVKKKAA